MRHEFPGEENPLGVSPERKIVEARGDGFSHEHTMEGRRPAEAGAWHTVRVILCTAIVFAFFAYVAYLTKGQ